MSIDLVLDTHILADLISQYYKYSITSGGEFVEEGFISKRIADKINNVSQRFLYEDDFKYGLIISSIFSFIEITRKFDLIADGRFTLIQFKAFLSECPPWLVITPLSVDLFPFLYGVPKSVMSEGSIKPIEWADAIQCATYLSRQNAQLATADNRIKLIPDFKFI